MHPENLKWKINANNSDIEEGDTYYLVGFASPKENPFYGKNQSFPIDLRVELKNEIDNSSQTPREWINNSFEGMSN